MRYSAFVDNSLIQHPRPYQLSLIVDREIELGVVSKNVRQAQAKSLVTDPIINFWGVKGIGKTWILHHLQQLYAYRPESADASFALMRPTFTLLYAFPDESSGPLLERVALALATEALSQLSAALSVEEQEELSRTSDTRDINALVRLLLMLSSRFVPLILLDNAEKVSPTDWENLELSLIEPLVSADRALVIVAGRRQVPRWRRFEVRRRVMESERSRVRPFGKETVVKHLEQRQHRIPVDLFFPYTAGNPHLIDTIAQHIANWSKEGIVLDQTWFDQHQNSLLEILRLSEVQLLENVPIALRRILDSLSPLRFYRLEGLRFILAKQEVETEPLPDGYYVHILRMLDQETEIVWWDRERRAYITSQDVRQLMSRRQLLENHEDFAKQHRYALDMYQGWVDKYPETSEDFIIEIWFHLANLYLADRDSGNLRSEVQKALHFACKYLSSDRFLILQKQLESDHELLDLLPEHMCHELLAELERHMADKAH